MEVYFMWYINDYKYVEAVVHPTSRKIEVEILKTREGDTPLTNGDIYNMVSMMYYCLNNDGACPNGNFEVPHIYLDKKVYKASAIKVTGYAIDGGTGFIVDGIDPYYVKDIKHVDYILDKKTGNFLKSPNH